MAVNVTVRVATVADAPALLAIYAPYVRDTAITFEYEVPSAKEFAQRIAHTLGRYPYLMAERDGKPVGYVYASPFKDRPAYDWSVETSIYVAQDARRTGAGVALHAALESCLRAQGVLNMCACIAVPAAGSCGDEHLDRNSEQFHAHMGYRLVGEFLASGYKFNRWYNMVWMEKHIGEHHANQAPVRPFAEVLPRLLEDGALYA